MREDFTEGKNLEDSNEQKKITRRQFLKKAGVVAGFGLGAAAVGLTSWELSERDLKNDQENERKGQGVITEKTDHPANSILIPSGGRIPTMNRVVAPEKWELKIKIADQQSSFFVQSKEEFDSYQVGEIVSVKYDGRDNEIKSIEKQK